MYKIIRFLTLLFVFLIPWQARWIMIPGSLNGIYWEYGTQSFYATEAIVFVLLMLLLAIAFRRRHTIRFSSFASAARNPAVLFVLWALLSALWAIEPSMALEHAVFLIEGLCIALVIGSGIVSLESILWTVIASAFLQASAGLAQFFVQYVPGSTMLGMASQDPSTLGVSVVETASARWLRAYGTFPHPNMLAGWLVMGIVSVWLVTQSLRDECTRITRACAIKYANRMLILFVLVFGLLATFSRSAYLAAGLFGAVLVLWYGAQKKHRTVLAVFALSGILASLLFCALYGDILRSRATSATELDTRSQSERISYLHEARTLISQSPVLGFGLGNYGYAVFKHIDADREAWAYQPVHDIGVLLLTELGLVGLMLMLLILYKGIVAVSHISQVFIFIPVLVIGFFDHYFVSFYSGVMMVSVMVGIFLLKIGKK